MVLEFGLAIQRSGIVVLPYILKFHTHDLEELKQSNDIDSATKYIEVSDKLSNLIAQDEAY